MRKWGGRRAQAWTRAVLTEYGTTCHLCGLPGATTGDHVIARVLRPDLQYVVANGRPAHHLCNSARRAEPLRLAVAYDGSQFFDTS